MAHRFILALCSLLLLSSVAQAERPEPTEFDDTLNLSVGQSEALRFKGEIANVNVASNGVVKVTPQSDHVLTFTGESIGSTVIFVYGPNGLMYSAKLVVLPDPGRVVRVYGHDGKDYVGFHCTEIFCGRSDKELGGARETGKSVEVTKRAEDGSLITTRSYGPRATPQ